MAFSLLPSFPTCLSAGMPLGTRRPKRQGIPSPNSRTPVSSIISFLAISYPRGGCRRPAPSLSAAPPRAGHRTRRRPRTAAEPAPRSAPRFAGGRERPSAPPVPLRAGCAVLFEAGAGGRTRRCQPPRQAGSAGIRAAVLRPPVSQRGGAGTRPGRSRQKAVRGVRAVTEPERGRQRGGAVKEDAGGKKEEKI